VGGARRGCIAGLGIPHAMPANSSGAHSRARGREAFACSRSHWAPQRSVSDVAARLSNLRAALERCLVRVLRSGRCQLRSPASFATPVASQPPRLPPVTKPTAARHLPPSALIAALPSVCCMRRVQCLAIWLYAVHVSVCTRRRHCPALPPSCRCARMRVHSREEVRPSLLS